MIIGLCASLISGSNLRGNIKTITNKIKATPLKPSSAGFLNISYLNQIIKKNKDEFAQYVKDHIVIPQINVTQHVSVIGDVQVVVSETKLQQIDLGQDIQTSLDPTGNYFYVKMSKASLVLTTKFQYKQLSFPYLTGSGIADVNTESVYGGLRLQLSITPDEKPQFMSQVGLELYDMKIHISEGGIQGWIINLLDSLFTSTINKLIANAVSDTIHLKIQEVNDYIAQQPFIMPINLSSTMSLMIDFGFDIFKVVDYLTVGAFSQVRFFDKSLGEKLPFEPVDLPTSPTSNDLLQIYVTDFVVKSLLFSLHQSNQISFVVTPEMVPPTEMIQLNTTSLKIYLPELYNKYPNQLVQLVLSSNPSNAPVPDFNITTVGMNANFNGELLFQVLNGSSTVNAFSVSVAAQFSLDKISLKNNATTINMTAEIDNPSVLLTLKQSWIGPIDIKNFAFIVNVVVARGVVRQLNIQLADGIPLFNLANYLPGLIIDNTNLSVQNGYVGIGISGEYRPSAIQDAKPSKKFKLNK
ncbi:hypothetical protein NAEGRDRAFT_47514 [Naegleria gruberi]|uniref:Lipid-binding serum glycoprotein C-terminal domain-containing protein n=1 Tax=Naegleria gruberi TaxID=5762 RepID=D2V8G5_NAEGR|nr:uncharacterized protein NAEGRDRAFT_47514 [Naegleria gruberi]EFC46805.1 hypothetical protein NAEGRDRAFT_47514 [Naegleria gruberi]|eukprot:XP_002679549.1 hypothetical protein NAEGRDRAFT_47514 [Naegleria gruberi strain NEG-M]